MIIIGEKINGAIPSIKKAIAEQNGDRVFSLVQKIPHIIAVIPKDPAVIADGRNEKILCDIFSVDINSCESGTLY